MAVLQTRPGFIATRCRRRNAVKPLAKKLIVVGRKFGPYLVIELLLPGGSLLALALWVYRTYFHSSASFAGERS